MRDREAVISVGSYPADRAVRIPLPQPIQRSHMYNHHVAVWYCIKNKIDPSTLGYVSQVFRTSGGHNQVLINEAGYWQVSTEYGPYTFMLH